MKKNHDPSVTRALITDNIATDNKENVDIKASYNEKRRNIN